ncbi:MAG: hypothetical protein RID09_01940 [Coleofasciculus sp. G1-WW12-02]|uniref:hypothetical protein n=1 Tax=unclassified Coleofasciculus TaxID=2692782 RepID=UPI0033012A85
MASVNQNPQVKVNPLPESVKHSAELFLSLATGPMLVGVISLNRIGSWLQQVGEASEEVFRGERLPILPFPDTPPSSSNDD